MTAIQRARALVLFSVAFLAALWGLPACETGRQDADDDAEPVDDDSVQDSDDTDDDSGDDDTWPPLPDDDVDDDAQSSIFTNPHDGRLYVAAGAYVVTPDAINHPCPQTLAGTALDRRATGVHDDLELRILVLARDEEHFVLVSGDLIGLGLPDAQRMSSALAPYGVDPDRFVFSSTHTHAGPDTVGIWGKNVLRSGRCPEYIDFLARTVETAVVDLAGRMVAVNVEAAVTRVDEAEAPIPSLLDDSRQPVVRNNNLTAARFVDDEGATAATLVNWHSHPEVMIGSSEYSADWPRWLRARMEDAYGGTCVYVSGTVGGLLHPLGVAVPAYTEDGERLVDGGHPVFISEDSEQKAWSMGYAVADAAVAALNDAEAQDVTLAVETTEIRIPVTNLIVVAAIETGLIPPYTEFVTDDPDACGFYGCFVQRLQHVRIGRLHMVSIPGEGLPESSIGRERSAFDFGAPWGVSVFPAMTGYRQALPEGHLLMDIGLANNEIGYILPVTDLHPGRHPDFYEEKYNIAWGAESIVREAITDMLSDEMP